MNYYKLPSEEDDTDQLGTLIKRALQEEGVIIPKTIEEVRRAKELLKARPVTVPPHLRNPSALIAKAKGLASNAQAKPAPIRHSQGIFFRRAAFDAYLVFRLADDRNLGRTKIEKITHLVEYSCEIDFEREPVRDVAGPVDHISRMKVESLGQKKCWYVVVQAKGRKGVQYMPGTKVAEALPMAIKVLGSKKDRVDGLIEKMRPLNTHKCEIVATLFSAWNDLLLSGHRICDEKILVEATEHWHVKKLEIPRAEWLEGLGWIRQNGVIPRGVGRPVLPVCAK
jgi:hypothetical protein